MRSLVGIVAFLGLFGFGTDNSINFDGVKPGVAPPNWTFSSAQGTLHGRWEVRYDPSAPSRGNVLEQVNGSPRESENPVALFDKVTCQDGDVTVKFKIEGRGKGRSVGLLWRYQNPSNYYLLHFSADKNTVALSRTRDGQTHILAVVPEGSHVPEPPGSFGVHHEIQLGRWYIARVSFRGPKIRVLFGNRKLFDAEDSGLSGPGKTGVWTHGKTIAAFDDFHVEKKD